MDSTRKRLKEGILILQYSLQYAELEMREKQADQDRIDRERAEANFKAEVNYANLPLLSS